MGKSRTSEYWRERVRYYAENFARWGPAPVQARLRAEAAAAGVERPPSQRTISRLIREFRGLPERERVVYRAVRWPEAMLSGLLPWEAGASLLELLTLMPRGRRPVSHLAVWYWRLSSVPARRDYRLRMAKWLASSEITGDASAFRAAEAELERFYAGHSRTPDAGPADLNISEHVSSIAEILVGVPDDEGGATDPIAPP